MRFDFVKMRGRKINIQTYSNGLQCNPEKYYSKIQNGNALTLLKQVQKIASVRTMRYQQTAVKDIYRRSKFSN
jgi:hypothetical protein